MPFKSGNNNLQYKITTVDGYLAFNIAPNSIFNGNPYSAISIPSECNPIGIITFATNNTDVIPININMDNSDYGIVLKNISGNQQSGGLTYRVLLIRQ